MPTLSKDLRRQLERVVLAAREEAERGAAAALESFGVGEARKPAHLDKAGEDLRKKLRAHGRQVGDVRRPDESQEVTHLIHECAYEHWHRMLFARFLAENGFLIEPDSGMDVDLDFCEERARETNSDKWEVAAGFAQKMLLDVFRSDDPALQVRLPAESRNRLTALLASLPREVFLADDSLGWVYQFWQAKKKEEVNDSGVKIGADELPSVTQLFTEDYMVDFLLDNTLGAWHAGKVIAANPKLAENAKSEEELRKTVALPGCPWKYLRFIKGKDGKWTPAAGTFDGWPKTARELKCLDPCMGSGHFVVAMFERLVALRMAEEKLDEAAAVAAVIRDNLFGLEIDPRCTQIGAFNLALAAWRRVGHCKLPAMNLACSGLAPNAKLEDWLKLAEEFSQRNVRPHPGPLPQEREKHPPPTATFNATGSRSASALKGQDAATATTTSKCSSDAPLLPPLPGGEGRGEGEPISNLADSPERLRAGMERLYRLFQKAAVLGSLINPRAGEGDLLVAAFHELQPLLEKALAQETKDDTAHEMAVTARGLAKAAEILAGQFTLVATNVPFLGMNRQGEALFSFLKSHYLSAKADLATVFIQRCLECCGPGGTTGIVAPQIWLFLGSYKVFRTNLLEDKTWNFVGRLGPGAFEAISGEVVNVGLFVLSEATPSKAHLISGLDVSANGTAAAKAEELESGSLVTVAQVGQLKNPDARVTLEDTADVPLLLKYADSYWGIGSGDIPRFACQFWEFPDINKDWKPLHVTSPKTCAYTGREQVIDWRKSRLELCVHKYERDLWLANRWNRGSGGWGKRGVAISQMGGLDATLFSGEIYQNGVAAIVPKNPDNLPAVWVFCSSDSFCTEVRKIDKKLSVTNLTLIKVPFDLAHWQKVAAEKYPHGLPKPFSSDPTQWLFNGQPKGADQPLHVAVARLLGYQWPRQTGSSFPDCPALGPDGLEKHADNDGVVCFSQARDEAPAAERLRALLADAYGKEWSHAMERKLIAATGSNADSLEEWLLDDFFAQHCDLFHNRPFVWHVWDGRKDGFNVLVNYHRLAGKAESRKQKAEGEHRTSNIEHPTSNDGEEGESHAGQRTLETLTYAYLGDWITRQKDAVAHGEAGADDRLAAANELQGELKKIVAGEPPYDLFIRWKALHQQPIGWEADINDGVRLNIRPFMVATLSRGKRGCGLFRAKPGSSVKWEKDRGKEPTRPKENFPWFWKWDEQTVDFKGNGEFDGNRWNDCHYTAAFKRAAREGKARK